jgi:hypothetical protein
MDDADPITADDAMHLAQEDRLFSSSISLNSEASEDAVIAWGSPDDQPVDELISDPEPETQSTRRILRTQIIPSNVHDATALVSASILAQRRGVGPAKRSEPWEDADHFSLATMRAGEQVKLDLGPNQTKRLFLALIGRYKGAGTYDQIMAEIGTTVVDGTDVSILRGRERDIVQKLLDEGDEVWDLLEELQPDVFKALALRKQHEARETALSEFAEKMESGDWDEGDWEQFFKDNTWIFGYGLAYQFLSTIQNQPHYGGTGFEGTGAERGDFLMGTEAAARFTVLVDIKKPETPLLARKPYRGEAIYRVSSEVGGGVAQLQANCATWFSEGAQSQRNVRKLGGMGIHTHEPKGILVVGRTAEFAGDDDKAGSFERFRRRLQNPEIITFDELYERARYLIQTDFDTARGDIAT